MRIRSVKPEYWQHRMHRRLSLGASLLGAALLDLADDEGRFEAEGTRIRGMLIPSIALDKSVEVLLEELAGLDWLALYAVTLEGLEVLVGQICAFEVHQVIQRPKPSLLPAPGLPWQKVIVIPSEKKEGKVIPAKHKWVRDAAAARLINDASMIHPNTPSESINDSSQHGDDTPLSTPVERVNDQSLGKGRKEGKGKEGSEGTCAPVSLTINPTGGKENSADGNVEQSNVEQLAAAQANYPAEPVLPRLEDVIAAGERCVPAYAPRAYCEWWFRKFPSSMGGWLRRGFLVDWPWELGQWWRRDQAAFAAGAHASCLPESGAFVGGNSLKNGAAAGVPGWKRLKELEAQEGPIWTHVANPDSSYFQKRRATREARKDLGRLIAERDALRAAERGVATPEPSEEAGKG